MYDLLPHILFAGAAISMFFVGATLRHRLMSHRMIGRRPILSSLSFGRMWSFIWSATALLVTSFVMAGSQNSGGPWAAATAVLFAIVFALIWLISQRCVSFLTQNFTFVFRWERAGEVSLHVNVRGPVMFSHLFTGKRRRARLVRQGMQEIRRALELSRQLPTQVSTLTLASPWFGHGRHGATLEQLGEVLRTTFPAVEIELVSITKTRLDGMLLLITPMGREWHRVAQGRGIEVAGYRTARTAGA
ncbi:hypothetical protein ACFPOU_08355 [Massilia jejuensis]|uniref:Uncharacterized protein n=1 Tax=Massilia jejuensis TaxID=648894 RepID=A0ABW0PFS4_9BURK